MHMLLTDAVSHSSINLITVTLCW